MKLLFNLLTVSALGVTASACQSGTESPEEPATSETAEPAASPDAASFPAEYAAFGDGYPAAGDACRTLGEGPATQEYLDHTQILVGCPADDADAIAALLAIDGAEDIRTRDGVTIISLPDEGAAATAGDTTVFEGTVTGNATQEHTFAATAGERIAIAGDGNGNPYFNIIPPGGDHADAIFVGSNEADPDNFVIESANTGEYRILVYLRGNAKDAGETRSYRMSVERGGHE